MCLSRHCVVYAMLNGVMHDHFHNDRTALGHNLNTSNFLCRMCTLFGSKKKKKKKKKNMERRLALGEMREIVS